LDDRRPRTARQRRPQAGSAPKARLDLKEVNPAVQQGKAIKTAIMTITTL
jgi:hypothetical protein